MSTSEDCPGECGENVFAEIHTVAERDALVNYIALVSPTYLFLGNTLIIS